MTYDQADYLRIPLLDGGCAAAQIFDVTPARPDCVFLGISTRKTGPNDTITPFLLSDVIALAFTTDAPILSGQWAVAGFDQIPRFRDILNFDAAARNDFPNHPTHDPAVIEAFVNAVHGLYPWDSFGDLFDEIKRSDMPCPSCATGVKQP